MAISKQVCDILFTCACAVLDSIIMGEIPREVPVYRRWPDIIVFIDRDPSCACVKKRVDLLRNLLQSSACQRKKNLLPQSV